MMDTLVAAAIHDAKNALTTLNARIDQVRRQTPSAALDEAHTAAMRVSAQLVELLTLYRAGNGSLRMAIADHYLDDFFAEVLNELGPAPEGTVLAADVAAAAAIGPWAFDAYQVKFVLLDALRNALRHARSRVQLTVAAEPGGGIRFVVADDGPGFPAETLAGIARPMNEQSSGLGLVFARLIATHHATPDGRRGRLELANENGARLSLVLP
jgi:signal transduction histidine kinase